MIGNSAFGRARMMMAAISAILARSTGFLAQQQIAALGEYRSRGKGMGKTTYSRKAKRNSTNAAHPGNGRKECARRMRHIAAGRLTASNGLMVESF